jgi:hypothetical protein
MRRMGTLASVLPDAHANHADISSGFGEWSGHVSERIHCRIVGAKPAVDQLEITERCFDQLLLEERKSGA